MLGKKRVVEKYLACKHWRAMMPTQQDQGTPHPLLHAWVGGWVGGTLLHASQPEAHACHDSTVSPSLVEFRALAKTLL